MSEDFLRTEQYSIIKVRYDSTRMVWDVKADGNKKTFKDILFVGLVRAQEGNLVCHGRIRYVTEEQVIIACSSED